MPADWAEENDHEDEGDDADERARESRDRVQKGAEQEVGEKVEQDEDRRDARHDEAPLDDQLDIEHPMLDDRVGEPDREKDERENRKPIHGDRVARIEAVDSEDRDDRQQRRDRSPEGDAELLADRWQARLAVGAHEENRRADERGDECGGGKDLAEVAHRPADPVGPDPDGGGERDAEEQERRRVEKPGQPRVLSAGRAVHTETGGRSARTGKARAPRA